MLTEETKQSLILNLLGIESKNEVKETKQIASSLIGKVCLFRTYSAGVHFGKLVERHGKECLIKDSRRIYSWVKACSLSQLAMEGSKDFDACKISVVVDEIFLSEVIEIILVSEDVANDFYGAKIWKS